MEFGYKAFAECSSLQWVCAIEGVANQFCSSTKLGHYLFRDCINLATFVLREAAHPQELPARMQARELSQGCLSSTGIGTLELTRNFQVLGAHACDNCQLLKKSTVEEIDLSNAQIEEIQEFTFVHCASLCEVRLPYTLHTIRVKAFMNRAALPELAIPPHCTALPAEPFWTALHSVGLSSSQASINGGAYSRRKCFCHLPGHEMAALVAHDP